MRKRKQLTETVDPKCTEMLYIYMGVSKNRSTPKWMVKIMDNPIKMG